MAVMNKGCIISDFRLQISDCHTRRTQQKKQQISRRGRRDRREDKDKEFYLFPLCDLCAAKVYYLVFLTRNGT